MARRHSSRHEITRLPRAPEVPPEEESFEGGGTQEIDYGSRTVLVVDDEPDLREAVADILAEQGFMVMTATNGRDALELMSACRPSAVVLDVMMPVMNGIELLEVMKREPALACVPVLLVTASHSIGAGDVPLLHKPVDVENLIGAIRTCIAPPARMKVVG